MKGCVLLGADRPTQNPNPRLARPQSFGLPGPERRGAPKAPREEDAPRIHRGS